MSENIAKQLIAMLPCYNNILLHYNISEIIGECQNTTHALALICPIYSVSTQPEFTCKVNLYNKDILAFGLIAGKVINDLFDTYMPIYKICWFIINFRIQ